MNKTKRGLILAAGILQLIAVFGLLISFIVLLAASAQVDQLITEMLANSNIEISFDVFKGIMIGFVAFELLFNLVAPITLLSSVRSGGEKFAVSKGLYITGVVFTILSGPISIPAILIYVSLGINSRA